MNGNLIGAVNTPTLASATGVWDIEELKLAQQQGTWPLLKQPDPDFEYVSLLLSSETAATNGAQNNTFQDSSTNNFTITRNGNTTQGSFSPYLPNWSNHFDGSGDSLTVPSAANAAFNPVNGFTIEGWVYFTANPSFQFIVSSAQGAGSFESYLFVGTTSSGNWRVSYGNASAVDTGAPIVLNAWSHFALSCTSTNARLFVNGTQIGTATVTQLNVNMNLIIGVYGGGAAYYFNGYLSNLRFVKEQQLYSSNFTPPASPLTAVAGTSLLTCQSNRFIDNSTNNFTITRNGDTRTTPFSPFSSFAVTKGYVPATYGGSGYFDGTGDYLTAPANTAFAFGQGDFTVEMWIYPTSTITTPANIGLFYIEQTNGLVVGLSNGYLAVGSRAVSYEITSSYIPPVNMWSHVAVTRSGATAYIFANGIQVGTVTAAGGNPANNSNYVCTTGLPTVAGNYAGGAGFGYFPGYISNLRVVKGTAVYTSNFTPPASPLTAISNTQLLTNFTNGGVIDSAALNVAETVGNAQVSTSAKKYGSGSYYFDGAGDWCTIVDKPELRFGTGAFTVDFWLYLGATGAARGIIGKGTASTGWLISTNSSNNVVFTYDSSTITSTAALSGSTWYFITVVRQSTGSNQTKIYINGINDGTGTVSTDFNQTAIMYVGANRTGGDALNGYISDLRLTSGVARYTANFTPPTASLPQF